MSTSVLPRPTRAAAPRGARRGASRDASRGGTARPPGSPLLVARDPRTIEAVLAAGSAAGVAPEVVREPEQIRARWRTASCVLVGAEMAALVCGVALEPRPGVHVLGDDLDELAQWSAPLQAAVLVLPGQVALLTQVLEQGVARTGQATVVRLVGGSGGVGTSTLACALGQQAAGRGLAAAVVELDPTGGGLDLLFGAETAPGWRWHDLRSAAGHVDSMAGRLPNVSGVDVVAHSRPSLAGQPGRPGQPGQPGQRGRRAEAGQAGDSLLPSAEAVRSVLGSLCRSHQLVVLDAGSGHEAMAEAWPGQRQLLLCGADVRGVVAAQARAWSLGLHDVELVVRTGAARRIAPEAVAESLGITLLGRIGDDRRVTRAAESGVPVGRGRRGYSAQVSAILDALLPDEGARR